MKLRNLLFALCLFILCGFTLLAADSVLVSKGKTSYVLVAESSDPAIATAIEEFQYVMQKATGAEFPKGKAKTIKPAVRFRIDNSLQDGEISIQLNRKDLIFSGSRGTAVLNALYYFLRTELNVRWLWPGPKGEFIPKVQTYKIRDGYSVKYIPKIKYRGFHLCGDWHNVDEFCLWMSRNFININRHNKFDNGRFVRMTGGHVIKLPKSVFDEHPGYFSEIDGENFPSQVCFNNSHVDKLLIEQFSQFLDKHPELEIYSMFAEDNQEYCRCKKCREKGVVESYYNMYNRITDVLKKKYPKVQFSTLAYQGYMNVPKEPLRNTSFIEVATYPRCNIHHYDGKCEVNNKMEKILKAWDETGVPTGNYAFEFDIFGSTGAPGTPYVTLIQDGVRKSVEYHHILVMPEISLSPKIGADIRIVSCKNRLPLYLYAHMMWNPDADVYDLLRDWCQTAYGAAADPMFEYHSMLDKQWSSLKNHTTILGTPMNYVNAYLTPEVKAKVKEYFAEADKALAGKENYALSFEKQLFALWNVLTTVEGLHISVPQIENRGAMAEYGAQIQDTGMLVAWTVNSLFFNGLRTPFEISLTRGDGTEEWFFGVTDKNKKKTWLKTATGKKNMSWHPEWKVDGDFVKIPFESLDAKPVQGESWQFSITQDGKKWPEQGNASLKFSASTVLGRHMVVVYGLKEGLKKSDYGFQKGFEDAGWKVTFAQNEEDIVNAENVDLFFFRNPGYKGVLPPEYYQYVRECVEDGATAVFYSFTSIPVGKCFDDDSLTVHTLESPGMPLSKRYPKDLLPGKWLTSPHADLEKQIRKNYTPAYCVDPACPEEWLILATLPSDTKGREDGMPYVLWRPFGKGTIIVVSADIRFSFTSLIENLHINKKELLEMFEKKQGGK